MLSSDVLRPNRTAVFPLYINSKMVSAESTYRPNCSSLFLRIGGRVHFFRLSPNLSVTQGHDKILY